MSKKGRTQNRARRAQRRTPDAAFELAISARLIGDLLGRESQCLQAAALMIATADALGYEVEPRLVSAVGATVRHGAVTGFVTGTVAAEAAAEIGLPAPHITAESNYAVDWAGHVVVILGEPPTLFDANFRQFAPAGFPPVTLAVNVRDTGPTGGFWRAQLDPTTEVRYLPDNRNAEKHLGTIQGLVDKYGSVGSALAAIVRSGVQPEDDSWIDALIASQPSLRDDSPASD